ncbi:MAG: hypothetical protein Q4B60_08210 [Erysipelotrichaceae bacterium]|nr:hypothetical protein [Erysipelotrichaceae bacterium]
MKEAYEILPDEYHCKVSEPKKKRRRDKRKEKKESKRTLRMISYVTTGMISVSVVTGTVPFIEKPIEEVFAIENTSYINKEEETVIEENKPVININNSDVWNVPSDKNDEPINNKEDEIIDEPLINETKRFITVTCPECHGQKIFCDGDPNFGLDRGNADGYPGCGGTGVSPCPDKWCMGDYRICENCKGSGIDWRGNECPVCSGSGKTDCEFCHGTGEAICICLDSHYECATCGGTGTIQLEQEN